MLRQRFAACFATVPPYNRMESRLSQARYLVGERLSVADISLYGYTHVAHEGGFDLAAYHGVLAGSGSDGMASKS